MKERILVVSSVNVDLILNAETLPAAGETVISGGDFAFVAGGKGARYDVPVVFPEGVTAIKQQAFIRCFSAEVIQVPDTVTTFGSGAFESCYALVALNIPDGVTAIPNSLCRACHSLRLTELPEGVTSIGQMAFSACFGFENFTIPSTVTSIGKFAFLFNDGASSITMLSTTPPTLEPTAFWDTILVAIYVPYSADHSVLNAYLAATGWSSLGDKIVEVAAS